MASSVACTVARNNGLIASFGSISVSRTPSRAAAPGLAVEKAIKISPDPFDAYPPTLEMPIGTRLANLFSWCGNKGASVATTTMIEPVLRSVGLNKGPRS